MRELVFLSTSRFAKWIGQVTDTRAAVCTRQLLGLVVEVKRKHIRNAQTTTCRPAASNTDSKKRKVTARTRIAQKLMRLVGLTEEETNTGCYTKGCICTK